jgi:hypothetical protein
MNKTNEDDRSKLINSRMLEIARLPAWYGIIRGTLMRYYRTCGNKGCHCYQSKSRRHGPYWYLSITWQGGKQKLYAIKPEKVAEVRKGIAAYKRLWKSVYRIAELNLALLKNAQEATPK